MVSRRKQSRHNEQDSKQKEIDRGNVSRSKLQAGKQELRAEER
jgi:hypothetical protein